MVVKLVIDQIKLGLGLESACWACELDPDDVKRAMADNPRIKQAILRAFSEKEKEWVEKMRAGGPEAKMALEILERTNPFWAKKGGKTLAQQLDIALEELKKRLDDTNYSIVLDVLSRNA
jgi:hypothetical protein